LDRDFLFWWGGEIYARARYEAEVMVVEYTGGAWADSYAFAIFGDDIEWTQFDTEHSRITAEAGRIIFDIRGLPRHNFGFAAWSDADRARITQVSFDVRANMGMAFILTEAQLAIYNNANDPRIAPFIYTVSAMNMPQTRPTAAFMREWNREYWEMGGMSQFETDVVNAINAARRERGLNEVTVCPALSAASRFHAQAIITCRSTAALRARGPFGGAARTAREFGAVRTNSVGWRNALIQHSPQDVVDRILNSASHAAVLLNRNIIHIGVGAQFSPTIRGRAHHYIITSRTACDC
jgi:uncharacterized protein YkwD